MTENGVKRKPICPYSDTSENLLRRDDILEAGQRVYDTTNKKSKIGDGVNKWSALPWIEESGSSSVIIDTIIDDTATDTNVPSTKAVKTALDGKANTSDIPQIVVDTELSSVSENPVQNKVVKVALELKANTSDVYNKDQVNMMITNVGANIQSYAYSKSETYTKAETDTAINNKLTNVYKYCGSVNNFDFLSEDEIAYNPSSVYGNVYNYVGVKENFSQPIGSHDNGCYAIHLYEATNTYFVVSLDESMLFKNQSSVFVMDIYEDIEIGDITYITSDNERRAKIVYTGTDLSSYSGLDVGMSSTVTLDYGDNVAIIIVAGRPFIDKLASTVDLSGYQQKLTFDTTPIADSTNPVTSGGVKTALDKKANIADIPQIVIDDTLSDESTNPVQNKVIKTELDRIKYYGDPDIIPSDESYFTVNETGGGIILGLTDEGKTADITEIVIPYKINGVIITSLGFEGTSILDGATDKITKVIIPSSVINIYPGTFYGCTALTSINIPNSVKSIGSGSFQQTALTSINIPSSVKSIGYNVFDSCTALTSINIPNSVTSIKSTAFDGITPANLTVYCEQGSYADTYANTKGFNVVYTDVKDIILSSEVLTKTNTTEFTPTEDYQPATKKYVDSKGSMSFDTDGNLVITIGGVTKKFTPIVE